MLAQYLPTGFDESIKVIIPPTPIGYTEFIEPIIDYKPRKTLWDWLELFIIPIAIALFTMLFSRGVRKRELEIEQRRRYVDQKIASERYNTAIIQKYLDDIAELLLKDDLLSQKGNPKSSVIDVAQAKTITALRTLGTDLIRKDSILQSLRDAQLADFVLANSWLTNINLEKANLSNINFSNANLKKSRLRGASLRVANFTETSLVKADLRETNLRNATFINADLSGCILIGANVTEEQLAQSRSLKGAILPNGDFYKIVNE